MWSSGPYTIGKTIHFLFSYGFKAEDIRLYMTWVCLKMAYNFITRFSIHILVVNLNGNTQAFESYMIRFYD